MIKRNKKIIINNNRRHVLKVLSQNPNYKEGLVYKKRRKNKERKYMNYFTPNKIKREKRKRNKRLNEQERCKNR